MKYLFLMLLLVSCSRELKYKHGDCVILNSNHFKAGKVFKLDDYTERMFPGEGYYSGCRVDVIDCDSFTEDEIEQAVNCPLNL